MTVYSLRKRFLPFVFFSLQAAADHITHDSLRPAHHHCVLLEEPVVSAEEAFIPKLKVNRELGMVWKPVGKER